MNHVIILPTNMNSAQWDRLAGDIWEAWEYQKRTGVEIRVVLTGWRKGLPVYERLSDVMVVRCPNCGKYVPNYSLRCPECGMEFLYTDEEREEDA